MYINTYPLFTIFSLQHTHTHIDVFNYGQLFSYLVHFLQNRMVRKKKMIPTVPQKQTTSTSLAVMRLSCYDDWMLSVVGVRDGIRQECHVPIRPIEMVGSPGMDTFTKPAAICLLSHINIYADALMACVSRFLALTCVCVCVFYSSNCKWKIMEWNPDEISLFLFV